MSGQIVWGVNQRGFLPVFKVVPIQVGRVQLGQKVGGGGMLVKRVTTEYFVYKAHSS